MATKKYVSLNKLSTFLDNLKNIFATKVSVDTLETTLDNKLDASTASSTYETKTDSQTKLEEAMAYSDNTKSAIEIVRW